MPGIATAFAVALVVPRHQEGACAPQCHQDLFRRYGLGGVICRVNR